LRASGEIIARSQVEQATVDGIEAHRDAETNARAIKAWYGGWWKGVVIKGCIYLMTMMCHLHRSL